MKRERTGWIIANLLLFIAFSLFCLSMSGCMTYSKALRKFGHLAKDSVTITNTIPVVMKDTVYVPGDTVSVSVKTDTTDLLRVVDGKRAKLTFDRKRGVTHITAEAKRDTLYRTITTTITHHTKCPPVATFGIAPWYKWAFFVTLGLLGVSIIAYIFLYHLKLSIAKR